VQGGVAGGGGGDKGFLCVCAVYGGQKRGSCGEWLQPIGVCRCTRFCRCICSRCSHIFRRDGAPIPITLTGLARHAQGIAGGAEGWLTRGSFWAGGVGGIKGVLPRHDVCICPVVKHGTAELCGCCVLPLPLLVDAGAGAAPHATHTLGLWLQHSISPLHTLGPSHSRQCWAAGASSWSLRGRCGICQ